MTTLDRAPAPTAPSGPSGGMPRRAVLGAAAAAGTVGVATLTGLAPTAAADPRSRPDRRPGGPPGARPRGRHNVVVVSVDDLGWHEIGCYGNTFNETPEIDRLAREGARFTQAYAAAPLCSPTRAALVTGRYPGRAGITDFLRPESAVSDGFLDPSAGSVADVLSRRGYVSGLIGKWHLSETYSGPPRERPGSPWTHGFTDVRLAEELYIGAGDYVHPYFFAPTVPAREPGEYLTDRLAAETEDFIATHRDEPFFVHVSNYAVHTDLVARDELRAKYDAKPGADDSPNRPVLAAMLESVDAQVGRIRRALERHGLDRDTLLLVTSDNGGQSRPANAPLRGGKGELYEGGIRVPLVAWGPGLVAAGSEPDLVTSTVDVLPTAAELAGLSIPRGTDGVSLVPTLTGRGRQRRREATYWVYPHFIGGTHPHAAVRVGDEKLVMWLRDRQVELYDLADDVAESRDRSVQRPLATRRLRALLERHLDDLDLYPAAPDRGVRRRERRRGFDDGLGPHTVVTVPALGRGGGDDAIAEAVDGRLRIAAPTAGHLLLLADDGPRGDEFVVELDPGPLEPGPREQQRTLFAGVAAGPDDYLLLRYRHDLRRVGWDLRVGGRLRSEGAEPLGALDGVVDLSRPGARIALVVRGAGAAAYVSPRGAGWQFLFRLDVAGALDLRRPDVRRRMRWTVGARVTGAEALVDGYHTWER